MSERHRDWPERLRIDPSAFIAGGAVVVGEVTIGARASVWFNTVVRGDTAPIEIGDDSNVQDNSTVHVDEGLPAIVGRRVTIGHRAIVHGCVIEDDCLVGMGAVVLSGARVGAGSLIGASSLVREGQVIPPGSLALGAPARVIGPVQEQHREAIAAGARHYAELAEVYRRRGLTAVHAPSAGPEHGGPRPSAPIGWLEWNQRLAALREGPPLVAGWLAAHGPAAFRRRPAPEAWSAVEVIGHLRDGDAAVFLPRVERVLSEDFPAVADVSLHEWPRQRGYGEADPAAMLEEWRALRARLLVRLEPLGPEAWARLLVQPLRGPHTLADLVLLGVEHELSHRRQLRAALGVGA
jgi:carbonic anhydrase/acetyltransferase-like protein (isoleucine patch superfamily)